MSKKVKTKRMQFAICTYRDLVEKFKKQSYEMNESMSRRIENFIISELKKGEKNDN